MLRDPWDPFGEMNALRRRVNRAFDEMLARSRQAAGPAVPAAWAPLVDILETEEALVFRAEIAGAKMEHLEIELDGNTLTLSGERTPRDEAAAYLRVERPQGPLRRSFTIGVPVDPAGAKATYRDGLLEVVLPKSRESRPRRVTVPVE